MDRIAVTGAAGQLGSELCRRLGERAIPVDLPEYDITSQVFLDALFEMQPAAVINAAAYTAVDRAEQEPEACYAVNVEAVARLAEACRELGASLVQISTDYVFGGDAQRHVPWRETDVPSPQGVYARSKFDSERRAAANPSTLIVRTCGLYARAGAGQNFRNFVQAMLRLAERGGPVRVVDDQHCTPSYVPHVAAAILYLLDAERFGVYHVVNGGQTTWRRFAEEVFRCAEADVEVEPITTDQFGAVAPRPRYSVLDGSKYAALAGPAMPDWRRGVQCFFTDR